MMLVGCSSSASSSFVMVATSGMVVVLVEELLLDDGRETKDGALPVNTGASMAGRATSCCFVMGHFARSAD